MKNIRRSLHLASIKRLKENTVKPTPLHFSLGLQHFEYKERLCDKTPHMTVFGRSDPPPATAHSGFLTAHRTLPSLPSCANPFQLPDSGSQAATTPTSTLPTLSVRGSFTRCCRPHLLAKSRRARLALRDSWRKGFTALPSLCTT